MIFKITSLLLTFLLSCSTVSFCQFTSILNSPISQDQQESYGIAWVDYDNNGFDDLFVVNSNGEKNALYKNLGDGTFSKILVGDLVNEEKTGRNSTWADYNNDGLLDVFIADQLETSLYKNIGTGDFIKSLSIPTTTINFDSDHSGAVWGDFDMDGKIDLFLASYKLNDNARNILYMNNGNDTFTQVPSTNIESTSGASQDPTALDFDNTGTLDLFIPNYCTTNFLYVNQGDGSFLSQTTNQIVANSSCSTGSSWADYDNDGDFDVFIQNNTNRSSQLYTNNGSGVFTEVINFTNYSSTSASWGDFDNDGYIDLIAVGGFPERKTNLYKNIGGNSFTEISDQVGISHANYSNGIAWSDYDNDGFLDLAITNSSAEAPYQPNNALYHNTPNGNNWIGFRLRGTNSNRSAVGAVLRLKADGHWQHRTVQTKTGSNSQNSLTVHFGMGTAEKIDTLIIAWPGNGNQEMTNLSKNQYLEIWEIDFPIAPSNLIAVNSSQDKVNLSWQDNSLNENGFRIERSKGNTNSFKFIGTTASDATSFLDDGINEGEIFYYRIASIITGGFSAYSPIFQVTGKRAQSVVFDEIELKFLDSSPFSLTATATSNLPISFRVLDGADIVTLSGNLVSILSLGTSTIGAYQTGNDEYFASDTVAQTIVIDQITGLNHFENELSVHPNPFSDHLNVIGWDSYSNSAIIFDSIGRQVYSEDLRITNGKIYTSKLPSGFYFLNINGKNYKVLKW